MKKTIAKILVLVFVVAVGLTSFTACSPRSETLKIYNWGEYMDETVIDQFKEWYADNHDGAKINVVYKEFDSNETLYADIKTAKNDWDLACPSDYMIEKLGKEGLLKEISSKVDRGATGVVNQDLMGLLSSTYADSAKYTVPYIWGTFGIMYDTEKVTDASKMNSWAALWDPAFSGKIYMKQQVRDSYCVAMLYYYRDKLKEYSNEFEDYTTDEYKALLKDIFTKFDDTEMEKAEGVLKEQKSRLYRYESDDGKLDMAAGTGNASLGLFWSCDAGFVMNDYESGPVGCSAGSVLEGNKKLSYVVPKEGSNVWVDGWVIPKYAQNQEAAEEFINFLLTKEICKLNSLYAGAPGANEKAMDELKEEIEADEDGFFTGTRAGFKEMYLEMMFPTQETLSRCQVMGDFGAMYDKMSQMFEDIKMG